MATKKAAATETKEASLLDELAAANADAQKTLDAHAVSQGVYIEGVEGSEQNNPEHAAEPNEDDTIAHFEQIKADRLAANEGEKEAS